MAIDEANSGLLEDAEELDLTALNECADCEIHYTDDAATEETSTDDIAEPETTPTYTETPSKWALKGRLRSWALWVSVLGAVGLILDNLGVFARYGIDGDKWTVIINAVGGILVAFGILNDPTNREAF